MHNRIALSLLLITGSSVSLSIADPAPPEDDRFEVTVLAEGMPQPLELDIASDGRIFFIELNGKFKVWKPDTKQVVEVATIDVWSQQENGLIGLALDPDFAANQWVYLQYSPKEFSGQHVSRFTLNGDALDMKSEKLLLKFEEQRRECCHHAGSMSFGPDGSLFISTGDNTHPGGDSAGFAPIDERPDRDPFDAQKSSSNTNDLRGKILRIKPTADGRYDIPDGNLFPKDGSKGRPEIYVMGCRNPWHINVDPKTGHLYWGEVGPDAGGDGDRGSRGYDEINQARKAGNFGWPYFVGANFVYVDYDFAARKLGASYDPLKPVNDSPNNTGAKELPPAQPAFIYYPYGASKEFPELGQGGRTACAGPVFHYEAKFEKTGGFPQYLDNCLLFYDWQRPFIKWARLDKDSNLVRIEPFTSAVKFRRPVDFKFASDGTLYMLDYGETWGANRDSKLLHIRYERGNRAPIAKAAATNNIGKTPLKVMLSSRGTMDKDPGAKLRYQWRVTPGDKIVATEAEAVVTFDKPGTFNVELTVTDEHGAAATAVVPVVAGNDPPAVKFLSPREGDFVDLMRSLHYELQVNDAEDGDSDFNEQDMSTRTVVTATLRRAGREEVDPAGLALMKRSDCFNCHAADRRIVGPPLLEIARKYSGDAKALQAAAERVIKGSTGVWGQVPMLPHSQHTIEQAREMVGWVFSLKDSAPPSQVAKGVSNAIAMPAASAQKGGGVYVLEATYTDKGAALVGALTGHAAITLRSRQIEGENADALHGVSILDGGGNGNKMLGAIHDNHWLRFDNLSLHNVAAITCRVSSASAGATIEYREGKPDGKLLGSVEFKPTGAWDKWAELTAKVESPGKPFTLFVVFRNPGKQHMMNFDWLRFDPK